jgi:uncharacterized membrane protein YgcG
MIMNTARHTSLRIGSLIFVGLVGGCAPSEPADTDADTDGAEPNGNLDSAVTDGTVAGAIAATCTPASVKGLSQQIIDEASCLEPDAYVPVPDAANLVIGDNIFGYLEKPARDALAAALAKSPGTLTVTSMLRTIAQQYLLYRWYVNGTCGISLAAKPGNSNHETGLAFDTPDYAAWRTTLSAQGFQWFGSADKPHFDFAGSGAKSYKGLDVKAFQRLWNRNNPKDKIAEDGQYGPNTEARLKKSPAMGFPIGAECQSGASSTSGAGGGSSTGTGSSSGSGAGGSSGSCSGSSAFTCSADGNSRASCDNGQIDSEACANGCLIQSGDDVCMGTSASWSCGGSYGTQKAANGNYFGTSFGCYIDKNGNPQGDPGDNCIPGCLAKAQGSICAGMSGPECERAVNWYAADAGRFGCMARVRITNPKNGKSAVVAVIDYGPACWVEAKVSHAAIDLSTPASTYLFGGQTGISDKATVHVVEVDPSTPLGPVP